MGGAAGASFCRQALLIWGLWFLESTYGIYWRFTSRDLDGPWVGGQESPWVASTLPGYTKYLHCYGPATRNVCNLTGVFQKQRTAHVRGAGCAGYGTVSVLGKQAFYPSLRPGDQFSFVESCHFELCCWADIPFWICAPKPVVLHSRISLCTNNLETGDQSGTVCRSELLAYGPVKSGRTEAWSLKWRCNRQVPASGYEPEWNSQASGTAAFTGKVGRLSLKNLVKRYSFQKRKRYNGEDSLLIAIITLTMRLNLLYNTIVSTRILYILLFS